MCVFLAIPFATNLKLTNPMLMLIWNLKSVKLNNGRPPYALHSLEYCMVFRSNAKLLNHAYSGVADVSEPASPPTTPMLVEVSPSGPSGHISASRCDTFDSLGSTVYQEMQSFLNRVLSLAYKRDILVKTSFTASYASRNVVFPARPGRRTRCRLTCAKFVLKRAAWTILC